MSIGLLLSLVVIAFALGVFGLLVLGACLIIRDTLRASGRWGLNLTSPVCGQCKAPMPTIRKPASLRQALWGGWTCAQCGFELDKWGKPVADQPFPAKWSAKLGEARPPAADPADERYKPSAEDYQRGDFRG